MAENKSITLVSTPSKLIDVVLAGDESNFAEWKFLVKINLDGMGKGDHLNEDCPPDNKEWEADDKALLSRVINCIDRKVILSMQHCTTVKAVWDLVSEWFSGSSNLRKLYQLSQDVYRPNQKGRDLRDYYYDFKSLSEALCTAMPITTDVKTMKAQRDQLIAFSWISGLDKEYEVLRSQLLGNKELGSLDQVFSQIQNASVSTDEPPEKNVFISQGSNNEGSTFVSQGKYTNEVYNSRGGGGRHRGRGGRGSGGGRGRPRVCFNCGEPGHFKNQFPKPPRQQRFANTTFGPEGHMVVMTNEELAAFNQPKVSPFVQSPPQFPSNKPPSSGTFVQTGSFNEEDYW